MIFVIVSVFMVISLSVFPYLFFTDYTLPETLVGYFQEGFEYLYYLIVFSATFFFGGIICEEYDYKTGYLTFPVINKYKLTYSKFLCHFIMVLSILGVFYLTLGIAGALFYTVSVPVEYYLSFGYGLIFTLAVSCVVTFFSSFLKNVSITIVTSLIVLLIAENLISFLISPDIFIEPLYSLNYLCTPIYYVLNFPDPRYYTYYRGGAVRTYWLSPTIEAGLLILFSYMVVFFVLSLVIFKRRQLK